MPPANRLRKLPGGNFTRQLTQPVRQRGRPRSQHKEQPMSTADSPTSDTPSADELKRAMKAFKKRLKLLRLDEESHITRRPVTGGKPSGVVAITPPNQFPQTVWDELVRL